MQMIDVLKKLAELDAKNPNVYKDEQVLNKAKVTESTQAIEECGMMPPTGNTPANFSINASAATGDEVANMLNNIMALAGVKKYDAGQDMKEPMSGQPTDTQGDMKKMLDTMNQVDNDEGLAQMDDQNPEAEGILNTMAGGLGGAMLGGAALGPMGAIGGGLLGGALADSDDEPARETDSEPDATVSEPDVDIAGVGGALAGAAVHGDADGAAKGMRDGEDESLTGANEDMRKLIDAVTEYDNTPDDATDVPSNDVDKMAYNPNTGDHRERQAGLARATPMGEDITAKLFADYQKFVTESAETNESGLMAWAGRKKHGKEYMNKASLAARNGASQAELGALKDKFSKHEKKKK